MSGHFDLDEVSLQCFTNKHVYKKYLAKKYPSENAVLTETREKAALRAEALVDLFTKLIQHSAEEDKYKVLDSIYLPFIEACIDYLEKNERREFASENNNKESDVPIKNADNV